MGTQFLEQILVNRDAGLVRLTVEQYHRMTETGILEEGSPIELLDGLLVLKDRRDRKEDSPMNVGSRHASILAKLDMLVQKAVGSDPSHIRCQLPITLPPNDQPEPDLAIVVGQHGAYRDRHPHPADILIVIEVADSSLRHDRDVKQRIYADAGIREYWIVDLSADQIEVYTQPAPGHGRYSHLETLSPGETVSFNLPSGVVASVSVSDVLL